MQQKRSKYLQLGGRIQSMQKELKIKNKKDDNRLNEDFTEINSGKMTPFMKLFWEQQKRLFTFSSSGTCYHPIIICFCLSPAEKSPSANEELCNTNILRLSSALTLKDY